eukprot:jgi/Undpi1/9418/HiC_scaffold_27.g11875.m1
MGRFQPAALLVLPVGLLLLRFLPSSGQINAVLQPEEACADFAAGSYPGSSWTLDHCIDVWTRFARTVPNGLQRRLTDVDIWSEAASELRRVGSPCLVASEPTSDGAGSSTIRHLATWIFAEEMGCDWVTPDWGKKHVDGGNGTVMYCHRTATTQEMDLTKPSAELQSLRRCAIIDWLAYFQFSVPSVTMPEGKEMKAALRSTNVIESVKIQLEGVGFANAPYDNVLFTFHPSFASQHLLAVGNWDGPRRHAVRKVLREAKENFHQHPRPWYDENPECAYDSARLNVAIHVRMGDRREFQDGSLDYFALLDLFMATVSQQVVGKGLVPPLFHIFSETLVPCPSGETGLFDEFPVWPVELDQIPACLDAETPEDCPEKRAGKFCSPNRPGIFRVAEKSIVLHVGPDVQNAMSCMIQADAVLMGCSTFGQVAGLLTKGISLFSTDCGGPSTPYQYKTIPPLAVAERGYLWVPVSGSWRDPVVASTDLLSGALDELIEARGLPR